MFWQRKREATYAREKRTLIASLTDDELREWDAELHSSLESIQQADKELLRAIYEEMDRRWRKASRRSNYWPSLLDCENWVLHWEERDARIQRMLAERFQECHEMKSGHWL